MTIYIDINNNIIIKYNNLFLFKSTFCYHLLSYYYTLLFTTLN